MADGRLNPAVPPPHNYLPFYPKKHKVPFSVLLHHHPSHSVRHSYCNQMIFSKVTYVQNADLATVADAVEFLQHRMSYEINKVHELNLIST